LAEISKADYLIYVDCNIINNNIWKEVMKLTKRRQKNEKAGQNGKKESKLTV
jgi:hypothetical protein